MLVCRVLYGSGEEEREVGGWGYWSKGRVLGDIRDAETVWRLVTPSLRLLWSCSGCLYDHKQRF